MSTGITFDEQAIAELACKAAARAASAILNIYHSESFRMELKEDRSPLTAADRESHQILSEMLGTTGWPVLSEEGSDIPYAERKDWSTFWMIDPLDGTKEFLKKNGEFTVNIALLQNAVPVFGVVSIPVQQKIYFGPVKGKIFCLENDGSKRVLKPSAPVNLFAPGIRVVASRSHMDERTTDMIDSLTEPVLLSRGSSLKFLLLAEGEADVYPRFAPTMEWDTAAADAILRALQIYVLDIETEKPLRYNKEDLLNPYFICRPPLESA